MFFSMDLFCTEYKFMCGTTVFSSICVIFPDIKWVYYTLVTRRGTMLNVRDEFNALFKYNDMPVVLHALSDLSYIFMVSYLLT